MVKMSPKKAKYVRTTIDDVKDATKKMSPHQDPKSKNSASLRKMIDNAKKKKTIVSPHTNPKKRMGLAGAFGKTPQYKPLTPKQAKTPMKGAKPKKKN
mgnify:FL=1